MMQSAAITAGILAGKWWLITDSEMKLTKKNVTALVAVSSIERLCYSKQSFNLTHFIYCTCAYNS